MIIKNIAIVFCLLVVVVGCKSLLQTGQTKKIMVINELNVEGHYVNVMLGKDKHSWDLRIGDPDSDGYLGGELVSIDIINRSDNLMGVSYYTNHWTLASKDEVRVYSGTLGDFWEFYGVSVGRGQFDHDWKTDLNIGVFLKFENANLELKRPLVVTASWSDSL